MKFKFFTLFLAGSLSRVQDTIIDDSTLLQVSPEEKINIVLEKILEFYEWDRNVKISPTQIVFYYLLSAYYFQKSSRNRSFSFQLRKILYLFRLILIQNQNFDITKKILVILDEVIVKSILSISSYNSDFSDVHDLNKFVHIFKDSSINQETLPKLLRSNISNFPDSRESIILYNHIKLRLSNLTYNELEKQEIFDYNYSISTQYFRLIELTYGAKLYEYKIKTVHKKPKVTEEEKIKLLKEDCIGYLLSLSGIIKIIDIYDNDYLVGNSFLAYHYYRMAYFFTASENTGKDGSKKNTLGIDMTTIEEIKLEISRQYFIERHDYTVFDPLYNYEMAAKHYNKAINLHSAGSDYKSALSDVHYLEDDLNDASYHFGAAMDRYLMINDKLIEYYELSKSAISKIRRGNDDFV